MIALIESEASDLPATARASLDVLAGMLAELDRQIGVLDAEIDRRARESEVVRRLMTIPGIGPLIATSLATLAPPPEIFRKGRDFAAGLGLTPAAAFDGREAEVGGYNQDGRAFSAEASDHRSEQRHHQPTLPCHGAAGHVAR